MPPPLSAISTSTPGPAAGAARMTTPPSAGVWRIAFWIRLKSTRWSCSGLPRAGDSGAASSVRIQDPTRRRRGVASPRSSREVARSSWTCWTDQRMSPASSPRELEQVVDQRPKRAARAWRSAGAPFPGCAPAPRCCPRGPRRLAAAWSAACADRARPRPRGRAGRRRIGRAPPLRSSLAIIAFAAVGQLAQLVAGAGCYPDLPLAPPDGDQAVADRVDVVQDPVARGASPRATATTPTNRTITATSAASWSRDEHQQRRSGRARAARARRRSRPRARTGGTAGRRGRGPERARLRALQRARPRRSRPVPRASRARRSRRAKLPRSRRRRSRPPVRPAREQV